MSLFTFFTWLLGFASWLMVVIKSMPCVVWHLHTILHWHHLISFHAFPSKKKKFSKWKGSSFSLHCHSSVLLCEKCKLKIIMSFSLSRLIYIFPVHCLNIYFYIFHLADSFEKNLSFKEKECVFKQHSNCFLFTSSSFSLNPFFSLLVTSLFPSISHSYRYIHTLYIMYAYIT